MEPSKVYFCDLHTHMGDGLPNKLKRLIKAAGIGQIDFENNFTDQRISGSGIGTDGG